MMPYMWLVVFASVSVEDMIVDPFRRTLLIVLGRFWPSLPTVLKFSMDVGWSVVVW